MSRARNLADTISGNYDLPQGYVTADSTDTFTNKSGSNSQWTNDASYATTTALTTATANSSNWDTAYGWGNHASAGYLTSFTEADTLDSVTGRGATTSNNITVGTVTADGVSLGDNEKAIFGTGSDLEIFHDGSNSYINDVGTGELNVRASTAINFQTPGGAASLATFTESGAVTLYYNGAAKLATTSGGVAVTGDITATGNITAYYSDDRLKTNLGKIENALEKVESLDGFYYEANETAQALGYKAEREVGVSAQSVEKIMPEVVAPAPIDEKYLTVRYERLVPLLIEAVKELSAEVKRLKGE